MSMDLASLTSGGNSQPVDKEGPLWKAWEQYIQSEAYANTKKWALHAEHVDGSLWAAFMVGWLAGTGEERKRCADIAHQARAGEIDSDMRAIANRIKYPEVEPRDA